MGVVMIRNRDTNASEEDRLAELLREAKGEGLVRGWYGMIVVRVVIENWVIQRSSGVECVRRLR